MRKLIRRKYVKLDLQPFSDKKVFVFGFKTKIEDPVQLLNEIRRFFREEIVEVVDVNFLVSEKFVQNAVINTLWFKPKSWITDPSLRLLAFLACERQIKDSLSKIGLEKDKTIDLAVIVVSDSEEEFINRLKKLVNYFKVKLLDKSKLFELSYDKARKIMNVYQISSKELNALITSDLKDALTNILVERMNILKLKI